MTDSQKEEILNSILKEHGVTLNSKDPIFAILTANEIILNTYTKELEQQLIFQKNQIEHITEQYLNKAKVLTEKKISSVVAKNKKRNNNLSGI